MPSTPLRISAIDGYALGARLWDTGGPLVILNSATGVRQQYYSLFADHLASLGLSVLTWDYRGIGESRPHRLRGFQARLRDWGQLDFEGVLHFCRREYPTRRLAALGHSVGGQLLGMAPSNELLCVAATVGSQGGWWGHWTGVRKLAMAGLWYGVMPAATHVVGYLPGSLGIGADLPAQVALEWARWGRRRNFFLDDGVPEAGFNRLRIPMQAWSFHDDTYAPKAGVDWLHSLYSGATIDRRHVAPSELNATAIGHFGVFRPNFRATMWNEVGAFLTRSLQHQPS